jgi:hypothetical protein
VNVHRAPNQPPHTYTHTRASERDIPSFPFSVSVSVSVSVSSLSLSPRCSSPAGLNPPNPPAHIAHHLSPCFLSLSLVPSCVFYSETQLVIGSVVESESFSNSRARITAPPPPTALKSVLELAYPPPQETPLAPLIATDMSGTGAVAPPASATPTSNSSSLADQVATLLCVFRTK